MPKERIRFAPLLDKVTDAATAAAHISDGDNIFISGFTAGYPKLIPRELVRRSEAGEINKINLYAGASTGDEVDGLLARAGLIKWRRPYMSDRSMRGLINQEKILFKDDHLSRLPALVRAGAWGRVDVAVVEVAAVTEQGHLIPTLSVGNTPTYVQQADKIILEMSDADPLELEGIHDIYAPEDPPYRMPIPIYRAGDRIGKPFIEIDPARVVAVVFSVEQDTCAFFSEPDEVALLIAEQVLDFVRHEVKKGRLPKGLPWQSGVGDVANAVMGGFMEDDFYHGLDIYSEVLQDSVLELIDMGKVRAASGSALTLSEKARDRFFAELSRYKKKVVLRPTEISNSAEVIRRLGGVGHQHRPGGGHLRPGELHPCPGQPADERHRRLGGFRAQRGAVVHGHSLGGQGRGGLGGGAHGQPRGPLRALGGHHRHRARPGGHQEPHPAPGGPGDDQKLRPSRLPRFVAGLLPAGSARERRPRTPHPERGL